MIINWLSIEQKSELIQFDTMEFYPSLYILDFL